MPKKTAGRKIVPNADDLRAEQAEIKERQKQRGVAEIADRVRLSTINDELHRLEIVRAHAEQLPVQRAFISRDQPALNNVTGRIVNIRRTRVLVDFGEPHGEWDMPIRGMKIVDGNGQGWELGALLSGVKGGA